MKTKQILRGDVWRNKDVLAAAKSADVRFFCVAYVTQACGKLFQPGDVLVCDASRHAVTAGETNPNFLLELLRKGVSIYSYEALHAKCAVFGDYVLLGSANMSESSANRLIELSVLQKDSGFATSVHAFIQRLVVKGVPISENDLDLLCRVWQNVKRKPWQCRLKKRRASCRALANHVATIHPRESRDVSEEEFEASKNKAVKHMEENGIIKDGRLLDCYFTTEKWNDRQPKEGDSLIIVDYCSCKKNSRAKVYGPAFVVMVNRIRKTHIVYYLYSDKWIPYGEFRAKFNLGKSVNRQCVKDDKFEVMVEFIKDEWKRHRKR